jgi:hypothetical protein
MTYIQELIAYINSMTSGNQMVAAAISAWMLAVLSYMLKNIPRTIINFLYKQGTTTLELDNAGANFHLYFSFLAWSGKHMNEHTSRTMFVQSHNWDATSLAIGPSYGNHFFFFKKRLYWMTMTKIENTGETIRKQIKITTYGRSHNVFHALIDEFKPVNKTADTIYIHNWDGKGWENRVELHKRPLSSVVLNKTVKNNVTAAIEKFYADKQWYTENGIPYKLGILLHGNPGCGKTSLVKALASHYNRSIYVININAMSDRTLESAISKSEKGSFILIEDFDSSKAVTKRQRVQESVDKANGEEKSDPGKQVIIDNPMGEYEMLSLTGVLNAIDGVSSLHENIIIMTTNDVDKIDPAVLRSGRCDVRLELPYLTDPEIREYISIKFPDANLDDYTFKNIAGCDLQATLIEHKDSSDGFLSSLEVKGIAKKKFHFMEIETKILDVA